MAHPSRRSLDRTLVSKKPARKAGSKKVAAALLARPSKKSVSRSSGTDLTVDPYCTTII